MDSENGRAFLANRIDECIQWGEVLSVKDSVNCFHDEDFAAIFNDRCPLPQTERISLTGASFSDLSICSIAAAALRGDLPNLRRLFLFETRVSDEGLLALAAAIRQRKLLKLEGLHFGSRVATDTGLKAIVSSACGRRGSNLPNLVLLGPDGAYSDDGFEALADALRQGGFPSLAILELDIANLGVSEKSLTPLMTLKPGRYDRVIEVVTPDCTYDALFKMEQLARAGCGLNICELTVAKDIGPAKWAALLTSTINWGGLPELRELHLTCCNAVNDNAISLITTRGWRSGLTKLQCIFAGVTHISDAGVESIVDCIVRGKYQGFEALTLDRCHITDVSIDLLAKAAIAGYFPCLQELSFDNTAVTDRGLESIAEAAHGGHLPRLQWLSCRDTNVGDLGLTDLARAATQGGLPSLIHLQVSDSNVTKVDVEVLRRCNPDEIFRAVGIRPDQIHYLPRRANRRILGWFSGIEISDWIVRLQLYWCIGHIDREALMSCGPAFGGKKLKDELRKLQESGRLGKLPTGQSFISETLTLIEDLFQASTFPHEAWEEDEKTFEIRVPWYRGQREESKWTPRGRKAWLYVDRYLALRGLTVNIKLDSLGH